MNETEFSSEGTAGVNAIRRSTRILTALARRSPLGVGLAELSRLTGVPHPSTRRILRCLIEEKLVAQNVTTRRYHLGSLIFEFGLCAPQQGMLERLARPALERIAAATGNTVYLTARSGVDAVCIDRIEGPFPIRVVTSSVGDRRPLGVGAVGLAILARLEESEITAVLKENRERYERYGLTIADLRLGIQASRRSGYGVTRGLLTPGVAGVGLAINSTSGSPLAGISIASTLDRIMGDRLHHNLELIREEVEKIEGGLANAATSPIL